MCEFINREYKPIHETNTNEWSFKQANIHQFKFYE